MQQIGVLFFLLFSVSIAAQSGSKQKIYSSFTEINDGLEETRALLAKETSKDYFTLIKDKGKDTTVVALADSLRTKSSELIGYINHVKILLIIKTEKLEKEAVVQNDTVLRLGYLEHFDDYYTPGDILLGEEGKQLLKGKFTAVGLKNEIIAYQNFIKKEIYKETEHQMYLNLSESMYYTSWEINTFRDKPLAGIITYLSKLQLDVMLTEKQAINQLLAFKSE